MGWRGVLGDPGTLGSLPPPESILDPLMFVGMDGMEGLFLFGQMCVDWLVVGRFPEAGGEGEGTDAWPGRKVSVWVRQEDGKKDRRRAEPRIPSS